jgi:hypothetical protein
VRYGLFSIAYHGGQSFAVVSGVSHCIA